MPASTRKGHVTPGYSRSLISIPIYVDANLSTLFTRRGVFVMAYSGSPDHITVLMRGGRDSKGFFELSLDYDCAAALSSLAVLAQCGGNASLNVAFHTLEGALEGVASAVGVACPSFRVDRTVAQLMRFYGKTLGNQPDATVLSALDDGLLDMFQGLSSARWRSFPPDSINTS